VQFDLIAVSFIDLGVLYYQLHAADTSKLSCNVRDNDTYLSSKFRVRAVSEPVLRGGR